MKAERGGAIAVWASSAMTLPSGQLPLNQQLYKLIFDAKPDRSESSADESLRYSALLKKSANRNLSKHHFSTFLAKALSAKKVGFDTPRLIVLPV